MARSGRELPEPHGAQLAAHGLLGDPDPELLEDPPYQIHEAPAHDVVDGRDRPVLDHLTQRLALRIVKKRTVPGRLAVQQTGGSILVEAQDPVPHRLQPNPADRGSLGPRAAAVDRGQSQKPPGLVRIARAAGNTPQLSGVVIGAKRNGSGHSESSKLTATLNHELPAPKTTRESAFTGHGITALIPEQTIQEQTRRRRHPRLREQRPDPRLHVP